MRLKDMNRAQEYVTAIQRRDEVIEYVANRYGRDHVAQIISFGRLLARAAIRDVGRALGYPLTEVDRAAKQDADRRTRQDRVQRAREQASPEPADRDAARVARDEAALRERQERCLLPR